MTERKIYPGTQEFNEVIDWLVDELKEPDKINNMSVRCVFCQMPCDPAPTKRGWDYVRFEEGIHFDCAEKVFNNSKRLKDVESNSSKQEIDVKLIEEVYDAFANWYHDDGSYDTFMRSEAWNKISTYASQFTPIASKEVEYRKALLECKRYFGENDKTPAQHRMYEVVNKALSGISSNAEGKEKVYREALEAIRPIVSFYDCPEDVDHAKIREIIKEALNQ